MAMFMDCESGEVFTMKLFGGKNIGKQVKVSKAFIDWCNEIYGFCNMWTLGTRYFQVEELSPLQQKFGRIMNEAGFPYIMVLEAGDCGKRWHIHTLLPGFIEHSVVKKIWEKVVGEKGLNVNFKTVETTSIGAWYVSKYLRKDGGSVTGVRRFRTSKGQTTVTMLHSLQYRPPS